MRLSKILFSILFLTLLNVQFAHAQTSILRDIQIAPFVQKMKDVAAQGNQTAAVVSGFVEDLSTRIYCSLNTFFGGDVCDTQETTLVASTTPDTSNTQDTQKTFLRNQTNSTPQSNTIINTIEETVSPIKQTIVAGISAAFFENRLRQLKQELLNELSGQQTVVYRSSGSSSNSGGVSINTFEKQIDHVYESINDNISDLNLGDLSQLNDLSTFEITYNAGNVGIGTTTPSSKLSVAGDINLTGKLNVNGTQALYVPGGDFTGTMYLGNGGGSLSYISREDGRYNTFVGIDSGLSNTTGAGNTANGYQPLRSNTIGSNNTANGSLSLQANTTGNHNTANGQRSLYFNTTGSANTANGSESLFSNTTGNYNTTNGYHSLISNTTGSYNTSNGTRSLYSNTTGYNNTANGYQAGRYIADGSSPNASSSSSVFLGYNTKASANGVTNETVIGYDATGIGSNTVVLGSDAVLTTALKGNVGIGTTTPTEALTVVGNAQFTNIPLGVYANDLGVTADGTLTKSASDERLKTNITRLDSVATLDKIMQLQASSFDWKSNGSHDIGLIAQEVELIFPELVFTNQADGFKGINYSRIPALLIAAVQEIVTRINSFADRFQTKELCLEDVCITKTQLQELLDQNNIQNSSPTSPAQSTPTATPTEVSTSTEPAPTEAVVAPSDPVVGEIVPVEPVPVVEPTPEPAPEPAPAPSEPVV